MATEIKYHTKEKALTAVTQDGTELQWCSTKLKNNEDVVMTAIKQNSWAFEYTSDELKSNKPFIMKALHEGVEPLGLILNAAVNIQSDIEVISTLLEKSNDGWDFQYAKGEAALNKELAAKALLKWGNCNGSDNAGLWKCLVPALQEFFQEDSWYEKAQSYLYQLEQEKQAEMVSGGSTTEDVVVW